jgi:heptosyltransferase I
MWQQGKELRNWGPDVTIDLQGLTKSALLAWLSGAPRRLGFCKQTFDGRELSTWMNNQLLAPKSEHMIDRGVELLQLLGVSPVSVRFELPGSDEEQSFAERTIKASHIEGPYAVINVGAGWVSKLWPAERYADVANHLWHYWGTPSLVVWSGQAEQHLAEEVVSRARSAASLSPATTLSQLRGLIRNACLFVGSDTGPMHLSVAVGTPTVGMIGPMPIERVGPYGPDNIGIQRERLADNKANERKTNCGPMLSISSQDVNEAVDRLMQKRIRNKCHQNIA